MRTRLAPSTRVLDRGRVLIGGSPLTVQRLRRPVHETDADSPLGQRWLATGLGVPVLGSVPPVAADQITVVVPAHGRPDRLARCVARLAPLDVVVVDDASDPALPDATLRLARNAGPAGARNAGLALVRTPYVALVDSDVDVTADDLRSLARNLLLPGVVLAGPRVRGRARRRRWWERYDAAFSPLDLGPAPAPVRPGSAVSFLPSACLVARTDALGPGFDPTLRVGEDVDLVWRLVGAGHHVRYDPEVVVTHDTRPGPGAWLRQHFDYGTSAAALAARHGDAVAPAVLRLGPALAALSVQQARWWSGPVAAAVLGVTAHRLRTTVPTTHAVRLAGTALASSVRQEASLIVRHWWPLTILATTTRTGRRMIVGALVVDTALVLARPRGLDPVAAVVGRRLADLAYGAGVWSGAVRARSTACLRPCLRRRVS